MLSAGVSIGVMRSLCQRRARIWLVGILGAIVACGGGGGRDAGLHPSCNTFQSDENCFCDAKDWGAGASWCASSCDHDDDCPSEQGLVCHEQRYCTFECARDVDCPVPVVNASTDCDEDAGVCDLIP